MERPKVILLVIATAVTAFFVSGLLVYYYMGSQERGNEILLGTGSYEDIAKYMEISDLEGMIHEYSMEDPTDEALVSGALKGMVNALGDPFSAYYTEEEFKNYTASSEGTFVGIGIAAEPVSVDSGYLRIRKIYGGSPAQESDLSVGDVIMAVDSVNIDFIDFEGALNLLMGPSGSSVTLTVATGEENAREIQLKREAVQVPAVSYSMLDDTVGLVVINSFDGTSANEFTDALTKLLNEENASGLVIDARGSTGGTIKNAVDVLDVIMPEGLVAYSIGRNEERTDYMVDSEYNNIPVCVVVNSATASAAEILAGAIQDTGRGGVVGTNTLGKGVEQAVQNMPYSGGGVKLTTAEFYTPEGHRISGLGIAPDVYVEMPADGSGADLATDPQIAEARNQLRAEAAG